MSKGWWANREWSIPCTASSNFLLFPLSNRSTRRHRDEGNGRISALLAQGPELVPQQLSVFPIFRISAFVHTWTYGGQCVKKVSSVITFHVLCWGRLSNWTWSSQIWLLYRASLPWGAPLQVLSVQIECRWAVVPAQHLHERWASQLKSSSLNNWCLIYPLAFSPPLQNTIF